MPITEPKKVKPTLDHWWPRSLFKFWANDKGVVNQLYWDGRIIPQTNPEKFGAIKGGHSIRLGKNGESTPWDQSFEHIFDKVDDALPNVVEWIRQFKPEAETSNLPFFERLKALTASDAEVDRLMECMLSLVVRSPQYRHRAGLFIGTIQQRQYTRNDQTLINLNIRDAFNRLKENTSRGKMLLLKSSGKEFVFGDGFFTNYTSTSQAPINAKIILPLAPCTALMFIRPRQYSPEPRLSMMALAEDEVDFINYATQIYSCDNIFYRNHEPPLTNDFKCHEFLNFEYHNHPWIDQLTAHLSSRFN